MYTDTSLARYIYTYSYKLPYTVQFPFPNCLNVIHDCIYTGESTRELGVYELNYPKQVNTLLLEECKNLLALPLKVLSTINV